MMNRSFSRALSAARARPLERELFIIRSWLFFLCCSVAASVARAATVDEDFASDPAARGWKIFGHTNLFHWNQTDQNLDATWDSSQTNSYFHRHLDTVLTKSDDFSLEFDLRLGDVAIGVNPNKPSTFELAIGFCNVADATRTNFQRGIGVNAIHGPRNLVEFDYFPDSGFGATISPTMVSSNNQFAVGFDFPLEITPGDWFHVAMRYRADNRTYSTAMTRDGQPFGPIRDVKLDAGFTDFRLDSVAISSYSDGGADGSILAHGVVDNLAVIAPAPPILGLTARLMDGAWRVEFASRSNWIYTLEGTKDFRAWSDVSPATPGEDRKVVLSDTNAAGSEAYYRVRAERP
jgi:hypothetical protein